MAVMLGLSIIILLAGIYYAVYNQTRIYAAQHLLAENELLRDKIESLSTEIDSILTKLRLMEEWEDEIRSEKNLKTIDKDIREMGIGGIPQVDTTFYFDSGLNLNFNLLLSKLAKLNNKVEFDYQTHQELLDQVKLKELLYRNTPSIYPTYGRITDSFGWRIHPLTKKSTFHNGLDIGNKIGTPVYATADGVVKNVTKMKLIGNYVVISHKFGYQTGYGHLHKILVAPGEQVKRGQIIALMGNSGRSTGTHLHYEVLRYNKHRNPYNYLNKLEDDIILSSD
ncbi:MAG: M23 family metallopeptidase [Candidatus Cloacimonetes bacterium]|nr:M23 family metallopeptidase [Candidatus Cloacimonadota bacterium]